MPTSEPNIPETTEPAERSEFHIDNDGAANWLLSKLANLEAEKKRVQQQAQAIVKQLESDAASLRYLYESELQEYIRQKLAAGGNRRKSVHFLQGTCYFRTVPESLRIADTLAALDYAKRCQPEVVHTHTVLDTARYQEWARDVLQKTGELLPGVEVTPEHETFRLTFGKSEA
jgi:hypothetical protein